MLHVYIASVCCLVGIRIKLIKNNRLVQIRRIPAYTGIIGYQHGALHDQFIKRSGSKRNQMDLSAVRVKILYKFPEFGMNIKNQFSVGFLQKREEFLILKQMHVGFIVLTAAEKSSFCPPAMNARWA